MVKIVKDELTELMGGTESNFNITGNPAIILIAGLQGSGKTTFSGKLANYLKTKKGNRPYWLQQIFTGLRRLTSWKYWEDRLVLMYIVNGKIKMQFPLYKMPSKKQRAKNKNVIIIDTAGRLAVDEVMMTEVANIKKAVNPQEILFVVDSMTGQDAVNTAAAFNERLDFTGVVLTKLDGDTRGGAALSIKYTVNKPIKFASSGEKMDTLDVFYPERMAQRILGMGDIVSLGRKSTGTI